MNPALRVAYGAVGQLARAFAALAPARGEKLARSLSARRGIRDRYAAWAPIRDVSRPLLWVHAPSVGEGLQARVVLEGIRQLRPDVQLAYTFFSPSAERFAQSLDVDFRDYLPFDTAGDADAVLDALRPSALVFSKLDLWPTLCATAHRRGVRLGMISATLATGSSRRGSLAGSLLRDAYALLDAVGAISPDDGQRLEALGVRRERIRVTGDTRFDQVMARAAATTRAAPLLAPLAADRPTLVAGSTWPADEQVLCSSWAAVRAEIPGARLIIAPHEPTPEHLEPLEAWARQQTSPMRVARLSAADAGTDVVVVDRTGVLGELYALADAAFVGGGFHAAGLHSVLEPAAYGVPVAFGPMHRGSREAGLLIRATGAASVATVDELTEILVHWLGDPVTRQAAGAAARRFVELGAGAAERSVEMVLALLDAAQLQPNGS
ncbi:MAG: glycosyltransferase N-terminal domain-containing protein [Gemmatimonadaceae bacterium]